MTMRTKTTLPLTIAALALAAAALPACGDLKANTLPVDGIAYRPDGSLVLLTQTGIHVYGDGALVHELSHIHLDGLAIPQWTEDLGISGLLLFNLSADGNTAAVAYTPYSETTSRVAVYRIPDGRLQMTQEIPDTAAGAGALLSVRLSADGSRLFVGGNSHGNFLETVMDVGTGAPVWTTNDSRLYANWSPDGATLYAVDWYPQGPDSGHTESGSLVAVDAGTGAVTWRRDLNYGIARALALVGDGALLATALDPPVSTACSNCIRPPTYPFWSTTDGTLTMEFPAVPNTWPNAVSLMHDIRFACNATDTCAVCLSVGLNFWSDPPQSNFIQIYKTDGTVLRALPTPTGKTIDAMAISPDGAFITIANPYDLGGGATVYRIADGAKVGARLFPTATF